MRLVAGSADCAPRTTYLAVTNPTAAAITLTIDASSVALTPVATGASIITMTFAAVVALFAFTLF
jgi:hypothetical protein